MDTSQQSPQPIVSLASSLRRYYPQSPIEARHEMSLDVARGERTSFQVVIRTLETVADLKVSVHALDEIEIEIRRVGYVRMRHFNTETSLSELDGVDNVPGLVPDPLIPEDAFRAGPYETNAFWVNLRAGRDASPGTYPITVEVHARDAQTTHCRIDLVVHQAVMVDRCDFPVTHWFYCDALSDFYKVSPFSEGFWPILEKYVQDLVRHGNDVMHTPIFTPSTDGVKRPNQLIKIAREDGRYFFDWSNVRRFVRLAKTCGIKRFEWAHFFTQWGCKNAIRIYEGDPTEELPLWPEDTGATSPEYRDFLEQFIPDLSKFLIQEEILDVSYFHISDEPHGEEALANYRAAREMLRELAPWMKFMDALSQLSFASEGLVDMPIPSISEAPAFANAGFPAWCYFCCGPRGEYLNRLMDTPLPKIRMSGWLFYRLRSKGFLHWGYNYWYKSQTRQMIDPFDEQAGDAWPGWAYGDTFVVYPGPDGPIDSIRWEVFAESLQDYSLLQAAGVSPDDPILAQIEDYAQFPKNEDWIQTRRREVLARLDAQI